MAANNDKITEEAINNLVSMFSNIDREMVTDIFLGCKKDFDKAVDQLIGMGAEMESDKKKVAEEKQIDDKKPQNQYVQVPVEQVTVPFVAGNTQELTANDPEISRLESLNLQLKQEYRRLADLQETHITRERELASKKADINNEQLKLDDERKKFEEQMVAFQQDKKRLEEHLSSRLKEMKEQMRKSVEENRTREEEARHVEDMAREESRRLEEEERARAKSMKRERKSMEREAKLRLKEEKRKAEELERAVRVKLAEDESLSQNRAHLDDLNQLKADFQNRERLLIADKEALSMKVEELTALVEHLEATHRRHADIKNIFVDSLRTLSDGFAGAVDELQQKEFTPENLSTMLAASLRNNF